jgi:iron(III) transport system substrate-binding protein
MGEARGREYLAKLATQNVTGVKSSGRQVLDQVIAGEFALALQIFNNHAPISKSRGAPIEWIPMEPAMAVMCVMSVVKGAPHPNAAKLLFEFIVSDDGQAIMAQSGELPVAPGVKARVPELRPQDGGFRAVYLGPEEITRQVPVWQRVYEEYFR